MSLRMSLVFMLSAFLLLAAGCSEEEITAPDPGSESALSGELEQTPVRSPQENLGALSKAADEAVDNRYIVQFDAGLGDAPARAKELAAKYGFDLGNVYQHAIKGLSARMPAQVAQNLSQEAGVLRVTQDRKARVLAQILPTGVDRIDTEHNPIANIDGAPDSVDVDIAIIDTGIDYNHPELNCVGGIRILGGVSSPNFMDDMGHGTHVAGTAAAIDNGNGVVGVAPGARLWGVKVLDSTGSGSYSDIIAGLDWVTARAADIEVANMSLGGLGWDWPLHDAVAACVNAGVIVVVAAGNSAMDVYGFDGNIGNWDDTVPAAFPEAATISAMVDSDGLPGGLGAATGYGADDSFASFSNFSRNVYAGNPVVSPGKAIDLILPGVDIYSTIPGGGYYLASGTSMASPHAAGLFGLYVAEHGRATNAADVYAIRQALIDAAKPQNSPEGLALLNDPDGNLEPLGWAGVAAYADVAIMAFSAPASVSPGGVLPLSATVANLGTLNVTTPFTVRIYEPNSGFTLARVTVPALPAGVSRSGTLNFSVPAKDLAAIQAVPPGLYTLVCEHDFVDPVPANDARSRQVQLLPAVQVGYVYIDPDPDALNAPWSLAGPDTTVTTGNGDVFLYPMAYGSYTITWGAVPGWIAPPDETLALDSADTNTIIFNGLYTEAPQVGTVVINPDPDALNAPWSVSGPDSFVTNGTGDFTLVDVPTGDYTVTWGYVADWISPAPETLTLNDGQTIIFAATYTPLGPGETIGFWFDQNATDSCAQGAFLAHVAAYIVYSDPSIGLTRGFECGISLSRLGGTTFNTSMSATFPKPATNVGVNTPSTGQYNYIVGYSEPLVTTTNTVVATMDIFYLEFEALTFDMRAAVPASIPGTPVIMRDDFSLFGIDIGSPTATLQTGVCPAQAAQADAFGEVRNLFR